MGIIVTNVKIQLEYRNNKCSYCTRPKKKITYINKPASHKLWPTTRSHIYNIA